MERQPDPEGPEGGAAGGAYDALRRLEERLDRASEAAERLIAEAAAKATTGSSPSAADPDTPPADTPPADTSSGDTSSADSRPGDTSSADSRPADTPPVGSRPPPAGWQVPGADADPGSGRELELLIQVLRSIRDLIPPELQRKLAEALRELLLAIRALIDWYLERMEQRRSAPAEVQDIPIL